MGHAGQSERILTYKSLDDIQVSLYLYRGNGSYVIHFHDIDTETTRLSDIINISAFHVAISTQLQK